MRHRRRYLLAIEPSIDAMAVQAHLSFKPSRILVAIAHGVPLHLLSTWFRTKWGQEPSNNRGWHESGTPVAAV